MIVFIIINDDRFFRLRVIPIDGLIWLILLSGCVNWSKFSEVFNHVRLLEKIDFRTECCGVSTVTVCTEAVDLILLMCENMRSMRSTKSAGSWFNGTCGNSFMMFLAIRNLE